MRGGARAALLAAALLAGACASPDDPATLPAVRRDLDALAARSAPDGDPATVDILVAPDEAYLQRLGSEAVPFLERAVAALDRVLGPEVGLRFRIGGAVLFEPTAEVDDLQRILWEARLSLKRGECDVVAAFTGQRCGDRAGAAEPELRLLLCADAGDPVRNLLREAAQLFGAKDYPRGHPGYDMPGPMSCDSGQPRTLVFDPANLARIRARRGALPPARPDALAAALEAHCASLHESRRDDLREAFLGAESTTMHAEGVAAAERLLDAWVETCEANWALAMCLRVLGRADEARARFADALDSIQALGTIGSSAVPDALYRHMTLETARLAVDGVNCLDAFDSRIEKALASVAAAFPGDAALLDLRASFRARAGDREAAEPLYREAAAAAPGETWPWLHLAILARADGDPALWHAAWRGARAADPLDPVLGIRWIEEGLQEYPNLIRSEVLGRDVETALEAAESAFPKWTRPAELRHELRTRRP